MYDILEMKYLEKWRNVRGYLVQRWNSVVLLTAYEKIVNKVGVVGCVGDEFGEHKVQR